MASNILISAIQQKTVLQADMWKAEQVDGTVKVIRTVLHTLVVCSSGMIPFQDNATVSQYYKIELLLLAME